MEQHPVPQNISSFQFKLIGDITLKQFSYCAGGVIIAFLTLRIPLIPDLLRIPLAVLVAAFGFGLAFVPIQERPLDRWLGAFIKSIYAPTQFVWHKDNPLPDFLLDAQSAVAPPPPTPQTPPKPTKQAQEFVASIPKPAPNPTPTPAPQPFKPVPPKPQSWTIGAPAVKSAPVPNAPGTAKSVTGQRIVFEEPKKPTPPPAVASQQVERLKSSYQELEKRLNAQMQLMQDELQKGNVTKERFTQLQQLLSQLLSEKDRMSKELIELRKQLETKGNEATVRPTQYKTMPQETTSTVKIVPPSIAMRVGVPQLTTYPNVITGIVKDSKGILLPAIILTVKDKDELPVRALKTNKLGQFAASTPLANGTYIIEVEDPKKMFRFERIEVQLSNQVLPPLEISAISERDVMRQKLSQEIFGKNNI
jgi:hypothetical protein